MKIIRQSHHFDRWIFSEDRRYSIHRYRQDPKRPSALFINSMTTKGYRPLTVTRKEAEIVGRLVAQQAKRLPLVNSPLRWLPSAGDKLLKASRRSRDGKEITLWTLSRDEARSLFHWGVLFFHPQTDPSEITSAECNALKSLIQK